MRYIVGLLKAVPMLAKTIEAQTKETVEVSNRVTIEVHTASFRTVRGYTIIAALCDELAFWQSDEQSAEPDVEVINALRPGMASILRIEPLRAQRRAVGGVSQAFRPRGRRGSGLAG
jgi:hypothetical protein